MKIKTLITLATLALCIPVMGRGFLGRGPVWWQPHQKKTQSTLTEQTSFVATSGTTITGKARIYAVTVAGTTTGVIEAGIKGLAAGNYTASAVTTTGTDVLGTFTVATAKTGRPVMRGRWTLLEYGQRHHPLPAGLNPLDIGQLVVTGSGTGALAATADFSACLTNGEASLTQSTPVTGGTTAPKASGEIKLWTAIISGTHSGVVDIEAKNLPANTSATVSVDGVDKGTVTTGTHGKLRVLLVQKGAWIDRIANASARDRIAGLVFTDLPVSSRGVPFELLTVDGPRTKAHGFTDITLPATDNLFTAKTVTVHFANGNVLIQGSF